MPQETVRVIRPHVAIFVKDLDASIVFYRRLFGVAPAKVRPGYAKFDMTSPPLNFTLNQAPPVAPGALSHLGIQVASTADVLAMRERWLQSGLAPRDEMQTYCCHALQDKAWVRDPDGNEWEVFAVLEDDLRERVLPETELEEHACCAPACCTATETAAR
jgi:catechol 2,3-dioxygenase-like lactoylglutathione lyase family enzyme